MCQCVCLLFQVYFVGKLKKLFCMVNESLHGWWRMEIKYIKPRLYCSPMHSFWVLKNIKTSAVVYNKRRSVYIYIYIYIIYIEIQKTLPALLFKFQVIWASATDLASTYIHFTI